MDTHGEVRRDQFGKTAVPAPLAPFADGWREELARRGFPPHSITAHAQLVAHLSGWMVTTGRVPADLTDDAAQEYLRAGRGPSPRSSGSCRPARSRHWRPLGETSTELSVAPDRITAMEILVAASVGVALGAGLSVLLLRAGYAARLASASTEAALLRERVVDLEANATDDVETAALLQPLASALDRVERQVHTLERDRSTQFSAVAERLVQVGESTDRLGAQTASLVGSLNSTSVRGSWGEVQLRRVLEHAGMLGRCDFHEQVTASTPDGRTVRPDVVVHLPGERHLVIDAKAPMTAFLAAQADGLPGDARDGHLRAHARALRAHVDALAAKSYWAAFEATPEMVVCFVPGESFVTAALRLDPDLFEHGLRRKVVLASPGTLLALLRTVAFTWAQDSVTANARELLALSRELYERLGSLAAHTHRLGGSLQRAVESYNAFLGSLESRVLVTARKIGELDLGSPALAAVAPLESSPRPMTALELLDALDPDVSRPELDLPAPDERGWAAPSAL